MNAQKQALRFSSLVFKSKVLLLLQRIYTYCTLQAHTHTQSAYTDEAAIMLGVHLRKLHPLMWTRCVCAGSGRSKCARHRSKDMSDWILMTKVLIRLR